VRLFWAVDSKTEANFCTNKKKMKIYKEIKKGINIIVTNEYFPITLNIIQVLVLFKIIINFHLSTNFYLAGHIVPIYIRTVLLCITIVLRTSFKKPVFGYILKYYYKKVVSKLNINNIRKYEEISMQQSLLLMTIHSKFSLIIHLWILW
jgi:hypothetical protein